MVKKVIIIGGGVIGLSIAYRLSKSDVSVVILEKGKLGQEASSAAAGMLRPQAESEENNALFKACYQSKKMFDLLSKELLDETGINIEYSVQGNIIVSDSLSLGQKIINIVRWQKELGLKAEALDQDDITFLESDINSSFQYGAFFQEDHYLNTSKYVEALIKAVHQQSNITIIENTNVLEILLKNGVATGVVTSDNDYYGDYVVIASGAWSNHFIAQEGIIFPVKGHCILLKPNNDKKKITHLVGAGEIYFVPNNDGTIVVGSTMEKIGFDRNIDQGIIQSLQTKARYVFPFLKNAEIIDKWIGFRPGTKDGLPILGKTGLPGCLIATGHFRNGILLSPITAQAIHDIIVHDKEADWLKEFSYNRFL